jgi:ribosomal protein S18 acetylase RimI-like enzyme
MNSRRGHEIYPARSVEDIKVAKRLLTAYTLPLEIDLAFQNYEAEFAAMPGKYAPPTGELLLARDSNDEPIACVGLSPLEPEGCCEMECLFIAPAGCGTEAGTTFVVAVIETACHLGYREMRLDTLSSMTQAIALYKKFGFVSVGAYYHDLIENSQHMILRL